MSEKGYLIRNEKFLKNENYFKNEEMFEIKNSLEMKNFYKETKIRKFEKTKSRTKNIQKLDDKQKNFLNSFKLLSREFKELKINCKDEYKTQM